MAFEEHCEQLLSLADSNDLHLYYSSPKSAHELYWRQEGAYLQPETAAENYVVCRLGAQAIRAWQPLSRQFIDASLCDVASTKDAVYDTLRLWVKRVGHLNDEGVAEDLSKAADWLESTLSSPGYRYGKLRLIAELRIDAHRLDASAASGDVLNKAIVFNESRYKKSDYLPEAISVLAIANQLRLERLQDSHDNIQDVSFAKYTAESMLPYAHKLIDFAEQLRQASAEGISPGTHGQALGSYAEATHHLKYATDIITGDLLSTHRLYRCMVRKEASHTDRDFQAKRKGPNLNSDHEIVATRRDGLQLRMLSQTKLSRVAKWQRDTVHEIKEGVAYQQTVTLDIYNGNREEGLLEPSAPRLHVNDKLTKKRLAISLLARRQSERLEAFAEQP